VSEWEEWLREIGFDAELVVEDGVTWVNLRARTNRDFLVPKYGRGDSREDALASAVRRWKVEQIGTSAPEHRELP
jgi:hypothetical protein